MEICDFSTHSKYLLFNFIVYSQFKIFSYRGPPLKFMFPSTKVSPTPAGAHVRCCIQKPDSRCVPAPPSFSCRLSSLCFSPFDCKMTPCCFTRPSIHSLGRKKEKDKCLLRKLSFYFRKKKNPFPISKLLPMSHRVIL